MFRPRSLLMFTTALLTVEAVFPRSESEFLVMLPGLRHPDLVILQPEVHPEQPLAPLFGTARTAASSGGFTFAHATISGVGELHANATVILTTVRG